jgi:hypothetical protein
VQKIKLFFDRADYLLYRVFAFLGMLLLLWKVFD